MSEPSLALQKLIGDRLVNDAGVTALVPADNIYDSGTRPDRFPRIVIGEGLSGLGDSFNSFHDKVFLDLHIWTDSPDLASVKTIAGVMRNAVAARPWIVDGFLCSNLIASTFRPMRDPDGKAHGVLSIEAILQERAA